MNHISINLDESGCVNRNRSIGIKKQRHPFKITLASGYTVTKHYYSYEQAYGHAIQMSLKQYLNINSIIIQEL
jgi:hypothetical protein